VFPDFQPKSPDGVWTLDASPDMRFDSRIPETPPGGYGDWVRRRSLSLDPSSKKMFAGES
jgi:hypothetical protein